jgi:ATP-dependent helicase/nuclease subunit A
MMQFTPEQEQAIFPPYDRNLIVVAGAGSGKTRVLVQRYMALLEDHPDWPLNALVAITFTRKAAQEMRDRVRTELQARLAAAGPDERELWANRLAAMASARIDTIHALCGTISAGECRRSGLDPRFRVLDEIEADLLKQNVIERVLLELMSGDEPDPVLSLFRHYDAADVRRMLMRLIAIPIPDVPDTAEAVLAQWSQDWQVFVSERLATLKHSHEFVETQAWLRGVGGFPPDKLGNLCHDVVDTLHVLDQYQPTASVDTGMAALNNLADKINLRAGSKKAWPSEDDFKEAKSVLKSCRDWAKAVREQLGDPPGEVDKAAAELMPLWFRLIRRVQAAYTAIKANDDLLDFDDLEIHTQSLLQQDEVRARYVNREFKHLLVDEFQDTNDRQWAIIEALTDPNTDYSENPARLFVVGDPKQSIYGFRGGDVRVFEAVRRQLNQQLSATGVPTEIPLVTSFRTHGPLINTFNFVFERLLQRDNGSLAADYEIDYGQPMAAHRVAPPNDLPPLELLLIDTRPRDPQTGDYLPDANCRTGNLNSGEARAWEATEIAVRIADMHGSRTIYDREAQVERPLRYGDVALLFQAMSDVVIYEDALRVQGIPYVTVAGRGYYDRQEVWDVLALLEALYNPYDDLSLATVLRSPMFSLSDEALFALRLGRDPETNQRRRLWDELAIAAGERHPYVPEHEQQAVSNAYQVLLELSTMAGRVTIYELIRASLARTGYLAVLTGLPDGVRRRANVLKLLDKALSSGKITLSAFTAYLLDLSDREVREGEADLEVGNAVTLMTVHASKGLEFPVVILPDTSRRLMTGSRDIVLAEPIYGMACKVQDERGEWNEPAVYNVINNVLKAKDLAERKRLLYVASTRAQDMLLVSGSVCWSESKAAWNAGGWLGWLLDVLEMRSCQIERGVVQVDGHIPVQVFRPRQTAGTKYDADIDRDRPLWENPDVLAGHRLDGGTIVPPLTRTIPVEADRFAYNLTATQIADLGSATHEDFYREKFRRSVLHDAPARVRRVVMPEQQKDRVPPRILGDIVHEALRWWRFPDKENDLSAELTSYAWRHGVVQPGDITYAVNTARGWLRDMKYTTIYRQIEAANRVYREIPFVYRTDKRVIHGIVDVLFQSSDGSWVIVDYKSSRVQNYIERFDDAAELQNRQLLRQHAARYYLQVGVYAASVERYLASVGEQLDRENLKIYIHYLRYGQAVQIQSQQWIDALSQLEAQIGKLIEEPDS